MPIYNLIEYSNNYSKTSGVLWQYCRDEATLNGDGEIVDFTPANAITNSLKIEEKITCQVGHNGRTDVKIMVPLK